MKSKQKKTGVKERHKELRFILLIAITCISFIPTTILALLSYFHYQEILQNKQQDLLENYINSVEKVLQTHYPQKTISTENINDLSQFLREISAQYDVFIIDKNGKLITQAKHLKKGDVFLTQKTDSDQEHLVAIRTINDQGWVLIVNTPTVPNDWYFFQLELVLIYLLCIGVGLLLIYQLIKVLTIKLRKSDIERMTLFSEIAHANRLTTLGKLAAGVAHEINNPLAALHQQSGLMHDLIEYSDDFPKKEKFIDTSNSIQHHVSRCQSITHQLLLLSQTGVQPNSHTDINELIHDLVFLFREEANNKNIQLLLQLTKDLPEAKGEEDKIQQILLSIITNAITAIGDNGTIQILTKHKKNGYIEIVIEDDGKGIEPSSLKHLFDPFFTTKDTGEGTGLGLAIANSLAKTMDGEINAKNLPKKGAVFTVQLPIQTKR